VTFTPEGSK